MHAQREEYEHVLLNAPSFLESKVCGRSFVQADEIHADLEEEEALQLIQGCEIQVDLEHGKMDEIERKSEMEE